MQDKNKTMKIVAIVMVVVIVILICVVAFLLVSRGQQANDATTESTRSTQASVESTRSEAASESKRSDNKSSQAGEADAWRTQLSGIFYGNGLTSASYPVNVTFDGDKVIVTGKLARFDGNRIGARLDGSEWHFMLTDSTVYGYYPEEGFTPLSKAEFAERYLPDHYPQIMIEVQDGYVTKIDTSS